jgi:hypothetical protein
MAGRTCPFAKAEPGGDDEAGSPVKLAQPMEEQRVTSCVASIFHAAWTTRSPRTFLSRGFLCFGCGALKPQKLAIQARVTGFNPQLCTTYGSLAFSNRLNMLPVTRLKIVDPIDLLPRRTKLSAIAKHYAHVNVADGGSG